MNREILCQEVCRLPISIFCDFFVKLTSNLNNFFIEQHLNVQRMNFKMCDSIKMRKERIGDVRCNSLVVLIWIVLRMPISSRKQKLDHHNQFNCSPVHISGKQNKLFCNYSNFSSQLNALHICFYCGPFFLSYLIQF